MKDPYTILSESYDYILRHVDYQGWYTHIKEVMHRFVQVPHNIVELGCGTGKFGAKFSTDGYTIFGIDRSIDMLRAARPRAFRNFRLICADMSDFSLKIKADFIFSVHDTMNYFLKKRDVRRVLKCVKDIMHEKSVFLFDITTEFNIRNNFDGKINVYKTRGRVIEWENTYFPRKRYVKSSLHFMEPDGTSHTEVHWQRIYSIKEMTRMLHAEGFEILGIYSDYSFDPPGRETVMINFAVRKKR